MEITSLRFAAFVLAALLVYYLLPRRPQNYWLLLVSYIFYAVWSWKLALVLLLLTGITFGLARRLGPARPGRARWVLGLGIALNLLALAAFRIDGFYLAEMLAWLGRFGLPIQPGALVILVPLGLSYRILENISYLIDVHQGQVKSMPALVDFALYLAYFPKMLAGPIERARSFLPRLSQPRRVDTDTVRRGFTLIVIGIVRKLIGDILAAVIWPDAFRTPEWFTAPELLGWLLVYGFSLYNDFAGYTSIARGASSLFGLELSPNFQQPFFAQSFSDFWNRWHISLSHWLRDYIYYPLTRALLRRSSGRSNWINLTVPPLVTMLASGAWHGFNWHMLAWGGLHGVYLAVERLRGRRGPAMAASKRPPWQPVLAGLTVFMFVSLAWVPFRLDLPIALEYWRGLLAWSSFNIGYRRLLFAVPWLAASLLIDWVQHRGNDELAILRWPRLAQAACLALALLFIFVAAPAGPGEPFVYQGF
jgi:D-alanyl-lipoteichoic acid acyltransferase DltB (MBOAT superfamily)